MGGVTGCVIVPAPPARHPLQWRYIPAPVGRAADLDPVSSVDVNTRWFGRKRSAAESGQTVVGKHQLHHNLASYRFTWHACFSTCPVSGRSRFAGLTFDSPFSLRGRASAAAGFDRLLWLADGHSSIGRTSLGTRVRLRGIVSGGGRVGVLARDRRIWR